MCIIEMKILTCKFDDINTPSQTHSESILRLGSTTRLDLAKHFEGWRAWGVGDLVLIKQKLEHYYSRSNSDHTRSRCMLALHAYYAYMYAFMTVARRAKFRIDHT